MRRPLAIPARTSTRRTSTRRTSTRRTSARALVLASSAGLALALLSGLALGACGDSAPSSTSGSDVGLDGGTAGDTTAGADAGTAGDAGATADTAGPLPDVTYPPAGTGKCDYSTTDLGVGKGLGEACTEHYECRYGLCLPPGDGNLVNTQFGFCTRGCNCGDTSTQLSAAEKEAFVCLLPPGNQGRWRHVVPKCHTVDDCKALSAQWTDCKQLTSGGVDFTCHAE